MIDNLMTSFHTLSRISTYKQCHYVHTGLEKKKLKKFNAIKKKNFSNVYLITIYLSNFQFGPKFVNCLKRAKFLLFFSRQVKGLFRLPSEKSCGSANCKLFW